MPARRRYARFAAALLALAYAADAGAAERLGALLIDPAQVSVAGISSGAFMANQIHIAHSADVMGAAMIAGGLYGCAVADVELDGVVALASQAVGDCDDGPVPARRREDVQEDGRQARRQGMGRSAGERQPRKALLLHRGVGFRRQFGDGSRQRRRSTSPSGFRRPTSCSRTIAARPPTPAIPG